MEIVVDLVPKALPAIFMSPGASRRMRDWLEKTRHIDFEIRFGVI